MVTVIAPEESQPAGAVLVIHSWWGLTESLFAYGSRLGMAGYLVGLSDLYGGRVAKTEDEARKLRARPRRIPMYKTLAADLEELRQATANKHLRVGVVGFSMGGHWAVWLSQRPEYAIDATVLYYAARGGSFQSCRSGILAHFAEEDPWVSGNARKTMEKAIRLGACSYQAHDYPGTRHWFAEEDRLAEFDQGAASLAFERDLQHLKKHLRL